MVASMYTLRGPWTHADVDRYLRTVVVPLRLAANMPDGFPVIVSLWFTWDGEMLWCVTHESSRIMKHLRRDNRVAIEVAPDRPPYRGVRAQAIASLGEGPRAEALLETMLIKYLGSAETSLGRWLLGRGGERTIGLRPVHMSSWDYTSRMTAAKP